MGKGKSYTLNRKTYMSIKKLDHNQMTRFIETVYKEGFNDGKEAAEGLSMEEVKEVVSRIKGIGEKRVSEIVEALEEKMNSKKPY